MASYTRQSSFADGDTITAALFNNEFNQLVNAFHNSTGHKHDGTTAEGPVIGLIGDAGETSPNNKVLIDTTNNYIEFYVEVSSAPVQQLYIADGAIIPVTDSDVDLGTTSLRFKDTYTDTITTTGNVSVGGNLTVTGNATISGNLTFGDADTDSINLAAEIDSNVIPNTDNTYDLGSSTKEWKDIYIDGTAYLDAINFNGTAITSTAAELNILDGVTSTAAELNILDGVTSTTAELNILDGVTSTAAELNILDGVTATATEINLLDGVTSTTAELNILDGVTSTATELNIVDGDTTATSTTLADADRVVVNDNGTMVQVALTDFETYFESALDTLSNVTTVGALNSGSITSGFGSINNGSSAITTTGTITYGSLSDGTITITAFADEDDMSSDSATLVPTQQSVKAYVDSQVTAQDLDFQGDSGGALSIDLDSETLTIAGGTGLDTTGSGNTLTVAIDSTVATLTGSQTLTNKTLTSPVISSISNTGTLTLPTSTDTLVGRATTDTLTNKTLTSPVINGSVSGTAILDNDAFDNASATTLATSESIKAYVDARILTEDTLAELNDTNITSPADGSLLFYDTSTSMWIDNVVSGDITIADTGVATIASGAVDNAMLAGSIANSKLSNSTVSFGGISLALGASDATPAFDLTDATNYPTSSLTGTITNAQLAGSIAVSKTLLAAGTGLTLSTDTLSVDAAQTQITSVGTLGSLTVSGDLTVDTSTLKVDSTNNRIGILNASPDVSLDVGSATDAVHIPVGTTAQRPGSPAAGYFRYNSTTGEFEGYTNAWGSIGGGSGSFSTNIFAGDGSTTGFTLSSAPSTENNLMVFIDGGFQAHDSYSVSGTTLTFSEAPANGRVITAYNAEEVAIGTPSDSSVSTAKIVDDAVTSDKLASSISVSGSARIAQVALTSSSNAIAWDSTAAANAYHVTTENTTFSAPSNAVEGAIISVELAQGATPRTIAWNTVFEFAASTAPTVTATANKTDIFSFRYNGSVWQEIGRVQNLAQT